MKFKLVENLRFWWPVKVSLPDPDQPGAFVEQQLKVQFVSLPREEQIALDEAWQSSGRRLRDQDAQERAQLRRICTNWDEVVDDAGDPVAFSAEAFDRALELRVFRLAVYRAYAEAMSGQAARLGN